MLVDPALAHRANGIRPAPRSARTAAATVSGARRQRPSVGSTRTCSGRSPIARAVRASDECAWSDTYTTEPGDGPPAASRATSSAVRLAAEPPLTSTPAVPAGSPSQPRNQSMTSSSTWAGPADSSHAPQYGLAAAAVSSASAAGQVVKLGMKAR